MVARLALPFCVVVFLIESETLIESKICSRRAIIESKSCLKYSLFGGLLMIMYLIINKIIIVETIVIIAMRSPREKVIKRLKLSIKIGLFPVGTRRATSLQK